MRLLAALALLACGVSASLLPPSAPEPLPTRAPIVGGGGSARALQEFESVSPTPTVDPNAAKEQELKANNAQDTADAVRAGGMRTLAAPPPLPSPGAPRG